MIALHPNRRRSPPCFLPRRCDAITRGAIDDPHLGIDRAVLALQIEILPGVFLLERREHVRGDGEGGVEDELAFDGGVVPVNVQEVAWLNVQRW